MSKVVFSDVLSVQCITTESPSSTRSQYQHIFIFSAASLNHYTEDIRHDIRRDARDYTTQDATQDTFHDTTPNPLYSYLGLV